MQAETLDGKGRSQALVASVLSLAAICVIAVTVWRVVPPSSGDIAEIERQLLIAISGAIAPEANERLAYLAAIFTTPLVLIAAVLAARRAPTLPQVVIDVTLAIFAVGLLCLVAMPDPGGQGLLNHMWAQPPALLSGVLVVSVLFCLTPAWRFRKDQQLLTLTTMVCVGIAVGTTFALRVYAKPDLGSPIHFEAFFYSISQIHNGAVCLSDVSPQYGCYGEFLVLLLRPFEFSIASVTIVLAILEGVALASTILFAARVVQRPFLLLICTLCLMIVTNQMFWFGEDAYFQYWPTRILFPAVSLMLAISWLDKPSILKALWLGIFAGFSIWWNLDSGAIVVVALGLLVVLAGLTAKGWALQELPGRFILLGTYFLGIISSCIVALAYLSLRAGHVVNPAEYLVFQTVFFSQGLYMLPLTTALAPWLAASLLAVASLAALAARAGRGPQSSNVEALAYLAVMAIGLFSYFLGRSHPHVFMAASWPFVLLAFGMLALWLDQSNEHFPQNLAPRVVAAGLLAIAVCVIVVAVPRAISIAQTQWGSITVASPKSPRTRFVEAASRPERTLGLISTDQALILMDLGRKSDIPGPSFFETLRRADAQKIIDSLVSNGPDDLFIGTELLDKNRIAGDLRQWVLEGLPDIARAYAMAERNDDIGLMHLKRTRVDGSNDRD